MRSFITIAVLVFVLSSAASADMMIWNENNGNYGFGFYDTIKIFSTTSPYSGYTIRAGELDVSYNGVDYLGYCVDLMQDLGDYDVVEISPSSDSLLKASYLYETHHSNVASGTDAAALQVAIWKVVNEDASAFNYDVTDSSSNFYISNNTDVSLAANNLLNGLTIPANYSPTALTKILTSETGQDVIIQNYPVPEPSTVMLLGIGGLFFIKREKA